MNESAEFRKAVHESLITYNEIIEKFRIGEKKKYCMHPDYLSYIFLKKIKVAGFSVLKIL
ncbi:MAG: hypothetical protein ACTSPS_11920 [Promethearchaeota archaeon]